MILFTCLINIASAEVRNPIQTHVELSVKFAPILIFTHFNSTHFYRHNLLQATEEMNHFIISCLFTLTVTTYCQGELPSANTFIYSALWVMQSTTGLRPMDCINKSGLIKGSEVSWLILQSQIFIRLDYTGFNPVNPIMHCYLHGMV